MYPKRACSWISSRAVARNEPLRRASPTNRGAHDNCADGSVEDLVGALFTS
jgi:hypothetical protein